MDSKGPALSLSPIIEYAADAQNDRFIRRDSIALQGAQNRRGLYDVSPSLSSYRGSAAGRLSHPGLQKYLRLADTLRSERLRGQGRAGDLLLASHHV